MSWVVVEHLGGAAPCEDSVAGEGRNSGGLVDEPTAIDGCEADSAGFRELR